MKAGYCIYTNKVVEDLSPEHIIPLALGGCNEFCVGVDRVRNSQISSSIDGKMANSYLMQELRQRKGYLGHSKTPAKAMIKSGLFGPNAKPVQVHVTSGSVLSGEEIRVASYSPIERKHL